MTIQATDMPDAGQLDEIPEDIFCPACGYNLHGAPGMKCSAPQQQNNAVAMSYYACGPLAVTPILPVTLWLLSGLVRLHIWLAEAWPTDEWLGPACIVPGGVGVAAWWWNLLRLARRTMPQLKQRATTLAVSVPALWLGLGVMLLVLLPSTLLYILVVIVSFGD